MLKKNPNYKQENFDLNKKKKCQLFPYLFPPKDTPQYSVYDVLNTNWSHMKHMNMKNYEKSLSGGEYIERIDFYLSDFSFSGTHSK